MRAFTRLLALLAIGYFVRMFLAIAMSNSETPVVSWLGRAQVYISGCARVSRVDIVGAPQEAMAGHCPAVVCDVEIGDAVLESFNPGLANRRDQLGTWARKEKTDSKLISAWKISSGRTHRGPPGLSECTEDVSRR